MHLPSKTVFEFQQGFLQQTITERRKEQSGRECNQLRKKTVLGRDSSQRRFASGSKFCEVRSINRTHLYRRSGTSGTSIARDALPIMRGKRNHAGDSLPASFYGDRRLSRSDARCEVVSCFIRP